MCFRTGCTDVLSGDFHPLLYAVWKIKLVVIVLADPRVYQPTVHTNALRHSQSGFTAQSYELRADHEVGSAKLKADCTRGDSADPSLERSSTVLECQCCVELQVLVAVRGVFICVHHCNLVAVLKLLCYNNRRTAGYHLLIILSGQLNQLK